MMRAQESNLPVRPSMAHHRQQPCVLAHVADDGNHQRTFLAPDTSHTDVHWNLGSVHPLGAQVEASAHRACTRCGEKAGSMLAMSSMDLFRQQHLDRLVQ